MTKSRHRRTGTDTDTAAGAGTDTGTAADTGTVIVADADTVYGIPWHLRSQGVLESACSLGAGGYAVFSRPGAPLPHCFKQSSIRFCRSGSFGSAIVWHDPSETSAAVMNAIRTIVFGYPSAGTDSATFFRRARPSS